MANKLQVEKLKEGVREWNAWRRQNPEVQLDFREAELFVGAFSGARLSGADFSGAGLSGANLSGADLSGADFSNANVTEANLEDASLFAANLSGAHLSNANLSRTDLRATRGYILDSCKVEGTHFPYQPTDPWGVLKVKYTGIRAAAHLLALGIFLVPFLAKVLFWSAANASQHQLLQATIEAELQAASLEEHSIVFDARVENMADALSVETGPDPLADQAARLRRMLATVQPCLSGNCRELPVWKLVLGLDQGWQFGLLTGLLILYNVARFLLTFGVSRIRQAEAENRTHTSPAKSDYWRLWQAHRYGANTLFFGASVAFLVNAWIWLFARTVWLPMG